jgi:LmbE family N-acetylglucosaminyl deacetylase
VRTAAHLAWLPTLACAAALSGAPQPGRAAAAAAPLPRLDAGTSLLVVAPHPDDETLCCAGLIQRVLGAGGSVSIVWITSGDGSALTTLLVGHRLLPDAAAAQALGARRMREARAAASVLGVPAARQLFLGYPDGGVLRLLSEYRVRPWRSGYTDSTAVPYPDALFPGHPYTGESLERDFAAVLARVAPTLILAPSLADSHPDHRAAGLLTLRALQRPGVPAAPAWYWIVHGGEGWPAPRELMPGVPLTPAPRLQGMPSGSLPLSLAEEDRKLAAVRAYQTQLAVLAPLLLSFVRSNELFAAAPGSTAGQDTR